MFILRTLIRTHALGESDPDELFVPRRQKGEREANEQNSCGLLQNVLRILVLVLLLVIVLAASGGSQLRQHRQGEIELLGKKFRSIQGIFREHSGKIQFELR